MCWRIVDIDPSEWPKLSASLPAPVNEIHTRLFAVKPVNYQLASIEQFFRQSLLLFRAGKVHYDHLGLMRHL